jgi:signal recognition particle subunit SRP54
VNKLIKMHRQMGDMMKAMGKQRGGLFQRMMGMGGMGGGGGGAPSEAELERMRAELGRLDPKALEALPKDLKEQLPKGLPASGGAGRPLPRLPGLPGLGGPSLPKFPGLPGLPGKKK